MLKSKIVVDLPSVETHRRMGPIEWVRSLFGANIDLRSGKEEFTVGAFSLVEGLLAAFESAGVTDAISFLVDKKVVYVDTNDVPDDLPLIAKAAEQTEILDKPFREMHLVLAHRSPSLHTIFDCEIESSVVLGQAEMTVEVSSRLVALQIQPGETADKYAERVKAFAAQGESFEPGRRELDALVHKVSDALRGRLVGARTSHDDAKVELIRPDRRQIAKFGELGFGDDVRAPQYRAVPTTQRAGAYADPFYYYYYDPYYDFMSYVLLDAIIHDAVWHSPNVYVVEPGGSMLFTGDDAASHASDHWVGHDAVQFSDGGGVSVDSSSWNTSSDDGGFWSSLSSGSDSGGSSCASSGSDSGGSSCASSGGSSCGSSCSGGSSCGSSCGGGSSCSS